MPSKIRFFRKDPNDMGRGQGLYYLRGHGIYSNYSVERDLAKKSKGWKKDPIGHNTSRELSNLAHTTDGIMHTAGVGKKKK